MLPRLALSVRQPWAWAIVHGGKDIENRSPGMVKHLSPAKGLRAIHAAKTMSREEYEDARDFMRAIGVICPAPAELLRGGIIGSVNVVDVVKASDSPWFLGPRGLVLREATPCDFIPSVGALGYFAWHPADAAIVPPPAKWMVSSSPKPSEPQTSDEKVNAPDLFGINGGDHGPA